MRKRAKFLLSSLVAGVAFYLYMGLPPESSYYGLMLLLATVAFCMWFGLELVFEGDIDTKIMVIILPLLWTLGYGLFSALLPNLWYYNLFSSIFFVLIIYVMFLVKNVFLVALGYKTVPLYRAAYTVSLINMLLTCFFLFDSLFSFKLTFWANMLIMLVLGMAIFANNYWNVAIELPDDGKEKGKWPYIVVPTIVLAQLAGILSFWPVGIFKGSIYLVAVVYTISGLIQAEIRDRLFRGTVVTYTYIGVAAILAAILATRWG